ncbi:restriction endonuclease subunit S [Peribacillus simplex]|uniref:restriction endonuclease subunit S n=1 Tax=Peribacillus simplex TaxID=1478 RepID=UPI000BA4F704|nr:restriction endonuclease subunit S [Peribacillus simplex]PAL05257.1 hypothetical protein B8W99_26050 [Peribacillus simplex]
MSKPKPKPDVRFGGFNGEWEEKTLGDVSKVYDGTHQTPQYTNSGIRFISVEDINDIYNSSKYISQEDFQNHFKINAKKGDIFMTRITAGVIGSTAIVQNDISLAYYVSLALIKPNFDLISTLFLNANMQSSIFKKELNKRIIHTAFPKKINLGDIGGCKISYTFLEEQQKIGTFFKQLDDTIALQQQLVDQRQQYKKAMLQKMFPQKGERVPKVRFDGFSGDWEEKKLNEVAKYRNGKAHEKNISYNGKYIVINSKFVSTNGKVKKFSNEQIEPMYKNEIAFVLSDVPNGRAIAKTFLVKTNDMYSLNQRIAGITPGRNTNAYFLYILMNRHHYFLRFDDGVGQTNLSKKDIERFIENYPSLEEQQKIGTFFKQLDDTIALHQKKLEDYKQLKKALLQRMFV